jgi:hypothetical protein
VIYTTDVGNSQIYAVDPTNVNRSIVSGAGGGGTKFGGLSYVMALYPAITSPAFATPEPWSVVLFTLGAGSLIWCRRRRVAAWASV